MTGKSHTVVATVLVVAAAAATNAPLTVTDVALVAAAAAVACFGALLPDIDQPDSRLGNMTFLGVRWFYFPNLIVAATVKHRGPTHSFLVWALCSWAALALFKLADGFVPGAITLPLAAAFSAGYLSHLLLDGLTSGGVPFWWPLSNRPIHLLPRFASFHTGSVAETVWTAGIVAATAGITYLVRVHP